MSKPGQILYNGPDSGETERSGLTVNFEADYENQAFICYNLGGFLRDTVLK